MINGAVGGGAVIPPGPGLDQFNVVAYGAVGDGTTNDTTSIQAAITALIAAGGGELFLPTKTFIVDGLTLANASHVLVSGTGTLKLKGGAGAGASILSITSSSDVTFRDVTIDKNGPNQTNLNFGIIYDTASSSILVDSVNFVNVDAFGFFCPTYVPPAAQAVNVRVINSLIKGVAGTTHSDDLFVIVANGGIFANNTVEATFGPAGTGCYIYESVNVPVTGNTFIGHGGSSSIAITCTVGSSLVCPVTGNTFVLGTNDVAQRIWKEQDNVGAVAQTDGVFSNNMIKGNGGSKGVDVTEASNLVIEGNHFDTMYAGILYDTAGAVDNVLIAGNLFDNIGGGTAFFDLITPTNERRVNNQGYNPVGVVTVAVPATTVAVAAAPYDRTFYITTAAAVSVAIGGGPTITLPITGLSTVRVPAGKTLTPAYATTAPTWVVEGE